VKASICVLAAALLAAPAGQAFSAVAPASAKPAARAPAKHAKAAAKPAAKTPAKPRGSTKAKTAAKPKAKTAAKPKAPARAKPTAHGKAPTAAKPTARHRTHATARAIAGATYASGRCHLTIPKSWSDYHGGKADPKDRGFNVTLGRAGDPRSMTATLKAMHGRVISDTADMVLMQVDLRGRGARQYWVVTKPGPGCRATVTFADSAHEAGARKIAQSLKKGR
jgi:hypothetical protein